MTERKIIQFLYVGVRGWRPRSFQSKRLNWRSAAKKAKDSKALAWAHLLRCNPRLLTDPVLVAGPMDARVTVHVCGRGLDVTDNLPYSFKPVWDVIRGIGLIEDDNPEVIATCAYRQDYVAHKREEGFTIELETIWRPIE